MAERGPDKVVVIVEEIVQKVYLLDPDAENTDRIIGTLQHRIIENGAPVLGVRPVAPPAVLGHRAKKGADLPEFMGAYNPDAEWSRFIGLTVVVPDEDGFPAEERKFTNTTVTRRPVKK